MTIEKTVLITGSTGFINCYIARFFYQKNGKLSELVIAHQRMHLFQFFLVIIN
jgi:nucleoside-diphosphate-sugar epimerase